MVGINNITRAIAQTTDDLTETTGLNIRAVINQFSQAVMPGYIEPEAFLGWGQGAQNNRQLLTSVLRESTPSPEPRAPFQHLPALNYLAGTTNNNAFQEQVQRRIANFLPRNTEPRQQSPLSLIPPNTTPTSPPGETPFNFRGPAR